jgi:hypothetical protein
MIFNATASDWPNRSPPAVFVLVSIIIDRRLGMGIKMFVDHCWRLAKTMAALHLPAYIVTMWS